MSLRHMPRPTPDAKTSFERPHPKPSASSFRVLDRLHGTALFNIWSASAVLVAGLLGTVLASVFIKAQVESAAQREFDLACNSVWLVLFGGTMSTLLLAGLMLWQQQRVQFYRKGSAAAEALVASEERFRTAAENLTDVVYDWDIQETIDWYGDIDGLTGYPPGKFPRTISAWAAILQPEDKARVMAALEAHVQGVAPYNIEYRIRKKDGESRWWSARGTALRDEQGEPYKMIGSISDITERKQAEDQLRVQVAAMEAAAEAIVITDGQGIITWINPAFTAMTGYAPADIVGRPASTFTPDMQPDPLYGNIQQVIADGKVWRGELVSRRKDGSLYTEELSITPVSDETGVVTNQIAIKKDITERKRMEAQLQQQQKMASVGALARGMAHEINNPIMGVMNYAELIKELAVGNAAIVEYAGEILAGGWRVAKMTQSLLGFTEQRGTFTYATAMLDDLVAAVLPPVAAAARKKGIALSCAIPADLLPVSCCRNQIEQVVATLLMNAIEAWEGETPDGGRSMQDPASPVSWQGRRTGREKRVVIQAAVVADGRLPIDGEADGRSGPQSKIENRKSIIRLTVEDNGPGIRAMIQERVFDPFFTTKDRTQHSGLGLWISRTFVHEHGGELTFVSEVGRGTRFHMDLPAAGDGNAVSPSEDVCHE